jgi:hypothetical protein
MTLPKSLNPDRLLGLPFPRDITLGELKTLTPTLKAIGATRIRFVTTQEPEEELPDTMTLGEFQRLVNSGQAIIAIDGEPV